MESDSAQCDTAPSRTPRSVILLGRSFSLHRVRLIFFLFKNLYFHDFYNLCDDISKTFENFQKIQNWLTLSSLTLRGVNSLPQIQKCNIAQSFAGNNFFFAGLSLPSMRILNLKKNICLLLQLRPTFVSHIFKNSNSNIFSKTNF